MKSVFINKDNKPNAAALKKALGNTSLAWEKAVKFTKKCYPDVKEEWVYSGEKYGWSFRLSDKKRVLVYLLPREGFFKIAFVFGQKATDEILAGTITEAIKTELSQAKKYAEGRGIRLEILKPVLPADILKLIEIKIKY